MRRLFLCGLICVLVSAPAWAENRYAVLVGVGEYDHADLPDLKYTGNDAAALAGLLREQGYDGVTLLTDAEGRRSGSLKPTGANIDLAVKAALKKCRRGDTVFIALAGHGLQFADSEDAFFCPSDARPERDRTETLISLKALYAELNGFKGVKIVMVDACRDDPSRTRGTRGVDADSSPRPPDGVAVLFSCSAGERAFERDDIEHGVFFHYVLKGMRGEAKDFDDEVTFLGLANYVKKRVQRHVESEVGGGAMQSPDVVEEPRGSLVLARPDGGGGVREPGREVVESFEWKGEERARRVLVVNLGGGQELEFVRIPKGTFLMGSPDSDRAVQGDEKPRHQVVLTEDFYIAKYEVTCGQFARFTAETGYETEAERDGRGGLGFDLETGKFSQDPKYTWRNPGYKQDGRHPVVGVSWNDAKEFCRWASGKAGITAGLPTEAQWEYACRGGTATRFFTGDDIGSLAGYANVADLTAKARFRNWVTTNFDDRGLFTAPVGRYQPNGFGLFDMTGNAWEWCEDSYDKEAYTPGKRTDPRVEGIGVNRVNRGGGWSTWGPVGPRSAQRSPSLPTHCSSALGFRVAVSTAE